MDTRISEQSPAPVDLNAKATIDDCIPALASVQTQLFRIHAALAILHADPIGYPLDLVELDRAVCESIQDPAGLLEETARKLEEWVERGKPPTH